MKPVFDYVLDLRGAIIPLTLLKVSQVFREIDIGKTLEILMDDPDSKRDLFKILPDCSYKLIEVTDEESSYRIRLRKEGNDSGK